jgi:hypothetical protein
MNKQVRAQGRLKLSKETLRALTARNLKEAGGAISGMPIDSCTYSAEFTCSGDTATVYCGEYTVTCGQFCG